MKDETIKFLLEKTNLLALKLKEKSVFDFKNSKDGKYVNGEDSLFEKKFSYIKAIQDSI